MKKPQGIHEPKAKLLSAQDAIQDAERLQVLLSHNQEQAERNVQLQVPFTAILQAIDQLEPNELRVLAQRLERRLSSVQS